MHVPDFWKQEETGWPPAFVHFGSDAYWLTNYTRTGSGADETAAVPLTPQQQFGSGAGEGHGYYSAAAKTFVWWGWIGGETSAINQAKIPQAVNPKHLPSSNANLTLRPRL